MSVERSEVECEGASAAIVEGEGLEGSKSDQCGKVGEAILHELHSPRPKSHETGDGGDVSSAAESLMRKSDVEVGSCGSKGRSPPKRNSKRKRKNLRRREKKATAAICSNDKIKEDEPTGAEGESTDADSVPSTVGSDNIILKFVESCVDKTVSEATVGQHGGENPNLLHQAHVRDSGEGDSCVEKNGTQVGNEEEMKKQLSIPETDDALLKPMESLTETSLDSKRHFPSVETDVGKPSYEDYELQAMADVYEDSSLEKVASKESVVEGQPLTATATPGECYTTLQTCLKSFEKAINDVLSTEAPEEVEEAVPGQTAEFSEAVKSDEPAAVDVCEEIVEDEQACDHVPQDAGDPEIIKKTCSNDGVDIKMNSDEAEEASNGQGKSLNETYTLEEGCEANAFIEEIERHSGKEIDISLIAENPCDGLDKEITPITEGTEEETKTDDEHGSQAKQSSEVLLLPEGHDSSVDDLAESSYHFPSRETMNDSAETENEIEETFQLKTEDLQRFMSALSVNVEVTSNKSVHDLDDPSSYVASTCSPSFVSSKASLANIIDENVNDECSPSETREDTITECDEETGERFHKRVEIFRLENPEETIEIGNELDGIIKDSYDQFTVLTQQLRDEAAKTLHPQIQQELCKEDPVDSQPECLSDEAPPDLTPEVCSKIALDAEVEMSDIVAACAKPEELVDIKPDVVVVKKEVPSELSGDGDNKREAPIKIPAKISSEILPEVPIELLASAISIKSQDTIGPEDIPVCYRTESSESEILLDSDSELDPSKGPASHIQTEVFTLHFPSATDGPPSENNLDEGFGDEPYMAKQFQLPSYSGGPSRNNNSPANLLIHPEPETDSDFAWLPQRRLSLQKVIRKYESSSDSASVLIGTADLSSSRTVTLPQTKPKSIPKPAKDEDDSKVECKCARMCTIT